jgi:hypothetical protein
LPKPSEDIRSKQKHPPFRAYAGRCGVAGSPCKRDVNSAEEPTESVAELFPELWEQYQATVHTHDVSESVADLNANTTLATRRNAVE